MSDLKQQRLARLHRQFLDAGDQYPYLHHAAAGNRDNGGNWPVVASDHGNYLGLPGNEWYPLLSRPHGTPFSPYYTSWLQIGCELWEGAFYHDGPFDLAGLQGLNDEERDEALGLATFRHLAARAAAHFDLGVNSPLEHPLRDDETDRWLEALYGLPFVSEDDTHAFIVRRITGDIFTASARAIDEYGSLISRDRAEWENTSADDGNAIESAFLENLAQDAREWDSHLAAARKEAENAARQLAAFEQMRSALEALLEARHRRRIEAAGFDPETPGMLLPGSNFIPADDDRLPAFQVAMQEYQRDQRAMMRTLQQEFTPQFPNDSAGHGNLQQQQNRSEPQVQASPSHSECGDEHSDKPPSANGPEVPTSDQTHDHDLRLTPAPRKAYLAFKKAEMKAERQLEDREAYDLLKNHVLCDEEDMDELTDYQLPAFDTWARHLRTARKQLGEQKYSTRSGRVSGRSVVRAKDV